jgi:hypothetical protein
VLAAHGFVRRSRAKPPDEEATGMRSAPGGPHFQLSKEDFPVNGLLKLSSLIDGLTERVGKSIIWLVLIVTLIGAGNAVMRYTIDYSSNAFLEIQWYLFSAIFLFCAGYTLMRNEHVRIDLIAGRFSRRGPGDDRHLRHHFLPDADGHRRHVLSWPIFVLAYETNEHVEQRRRPDRLAGAPDGPDRLLPAGHAGHFGTDQAHWLPAGPVPDPAKGSTIRPPKKNSRWPSRPKGRTVMTEFLIANMAPIIFARWSSSCSSAFRSPSPWPPTASSSA